jgi:hypothetical protein
MIFDSKRRQTAEAEAVTSAEEAYAGRSVAPDDVQVSPTGSRRHVDRTAERDEDAAIDRSIANARYADDDVGGTVVPRPAGRPMERTGIETDSRQRSDVDELEPLFSTEDADDFRRGWDALQIGFVDDPRQAVQSADELVDRVLRSLRENFAGERSRLKAQVAQVGPIPTEDLRVTLRRYRSFFHRLLAL